MTLASQAIESFASVLVNIFVRSIPLKMLRCESARAKEGELLKNIMDTHNCVNVFLSEGSGLKDIDIVAKIEANGEEVPKDAFGHFNLDKISPGVYFSRRLAELVGAKKTMVQTSGYFSRVAAANEFHNIGVEAAISGTSGYLGEDEDKEGHPIRAIESERVNGDKYFDVSQD